ncbi:PREDICTED: apical endosomal glycoprotein, partial [Mesitornis unicolor]|uniref:apical endosomal glycoprotein n=1 Tax=Mesitornis unicolor TaxID=54374 RepID=UPI000528736A
MVTCPSTANHLAINPAGKQITAGLKSTTGQVPGSRFQPRAGGVGSPARIVLPSMATVVNTCDSAAEQLCNFVCDCGDCSDENQCGYLQGSAVLGVPFSCDFEEGDCGWQDVSTSAYKWVRGQANLAAWGTGPHSDHTVGTDLGWFMVTVSPPAKTTATAWLRSPVMQEAAATCEIMAWYHLSGSGLNGTEQPVLRLAMAYGKEVVELWQSPQHRGEGWHQLVAYPGRVTEPFQLTFSLTQPPASGAELALDDIIFRNCGLQAPGQQLCETEESLAWHRFCDGTDDCGDGSDENAPQCKSFTRCSFEQNLCDWEAKAGQLVWERNTSLKLGTAYGVPTRDHSNNSLAGSFLHVGNASATGTRGMAQLISPTFQATNSCSLVLYCHLHGSPTSSLSISYVVNSVQHLVRERTGDLGSCWVRERVDFNVTTSFKILEGVAGGTGTVAIDDLILSPGCVRVHEKTPMTLPSRAGAGSCAAGEVACDSGDCISEELACDFTKTCTDGSDEKHCVALQAGEGQMLDVAKARTPLLGPSGPTCALEMSYSIRSGPQAPLCPIATVLDVKWVRGTGQGQGSGHTTGTGHYMVVSTGRGSLPVGRTAALTSQPYQSSAPAHCLAFWYQLSTKTPGSLEVFVEQNGMRRKVMGVSTMEGDAWHRDHVTVQPDGDWKVIFEAVGAGGDHGYIALDDLHVSDGACPEPASCDCERDMCGWSSPPDPRLHSFFFCVPLAKYPGPEQDHTLGTRN